MAINESELSIEELKSQAGLYGIHFPGNVSKAKLAEMIAEFKASTPDTESNEVGSAISTDDVKGENNKLES